jgi:hypothetical protein
MAKYKPAGRKKASKGPQAKGALPCIMIIVLGIALMVGLFYAMLHTSQTPVPKTTTPPGQTK